MRISRAAATGVAVLLARILGLTTDALGVERVVVHRMVR